MWMMGCGDAAVGLSSAATSVKKLRPLMPMHSAPTSQIASSSSSSSSPSCHPTNNSCFRSINGHDHFFALRNHFAAGDNGKRSELVGTMGQQVVSSRWNPTPEQLRMLEDLYQRGTRTPSAEQIQHITAQLRRFGKIEGKNVFYWFQNHKARERQKRRRKVESEDHGPCEHGHKKDHSPGPQAVDMQTDQMMSKNINVPCTDNHLQESSCLCARLLTPLSDRKSSDWQVVHLVPASPPPSYIAATATSVAATAVGIFDVHDEEAAREVGDRQTLELFPLHNDLSHHQGTASSLPNATLGAFQFYQFLPLKN